ncbi:MAG: hypothetical protein ACLUFN_03775 [Eubacterium sp.]
MKKLLSIVLSVIMIFAVSSLTTIAFAETVNSIESTTKASSTIGKVNGQTSNDVTYERDPENPNKITFTYVGEGDITGWEFPGMTEGVDYRIISQDGNSITIELLNGYDGDVIGDAQVDFDGEETTTKKSSTGKSKSPKTGAVAATGLAAAGVGVAILAAIKKNDAE